METLGNGKYVGKIGAHIASRRDVADGRRRTKTRGLKVLWTREFQVRVPDLYVIRTPILDPHGCLDGLVGSSYIDRRRRQRDCLRYGRKRNLRKCNSRTGNQEDGTERDPAEPGEVCHLHLPPD